MPTTAKRSTALFAGEILHFAEGPTHMRKVKRGFRERLMSIGWCIILKC